MQRAAQHGFSLIEVMIALVILAVGLLALNAMQGTFATGNAQSRQFLRATDLASQQLELLKNVPYDDSLLDDVDGDGLGGLGDTGAAADQNRTASYSRDYRLYWNIAENATANLKRVRIIVHWDQGNRHVSLDWTKPRSF